MIVRKRDIIRWYYLVNTVRGRIMLFTMFVELLTLLIISMEQDASINSSQNKFALKHKNYPQHPLVPRPESLVASNKFNAMEDVGQSENKDENGFYKYDKYEHLPDVEKEFERRMNPNRFDHEVQDTPVKNPAGNDETYSDDQNEDGSNSKNDGGARKIRSHYGVDDGVVVVKPPVLAVFLWSTYLTFYVYNFFVTLGMATIRMGFRVDRKTTAMMYLITLILNVALMVLAIIAMETGAVTGSVIIILLGAGILLLNTALPVDDWRPIINWFQFRCVMMFHHPPHFPQNPAPHPPFNPPPNLPLNPPPNVSLNSLQNSLAISTPTLKPNSTPSSSPSRAPPMENAEVDVNLAIAGPSRINASAQPRHSDVELGDKDTSDQRVDVGDIGKSSPKVRFVIEDAGSGDSIFTYSPGKVSPIATISKSVILQGKKGNAKVTTSGAHCRNVANLPECARNQEPVTLEEEAQAVLLEEEQRPNLMGLQIHLSLKQTEGNGRSMEPENNPKQKSRNCGETKNKLRKSLNSFSNNNNGNQHEVRNSNYVQNNGRKTVENNGSEIVENNGSETVENNGSEIVENNGSEIVENNGSEIVENNGSEIIENNGSEIIENNGSEIIEYNGSETAEIKRNSR